MKRWFGNKYLYLTKRELLALVAKFLGVILLLDITFYRNFISLFMLIPVGMLFIKKEYRELMDKKRNDISLEFKEFLLLACTSLRAGYSVENAFINSYGDMKKLYGEHSAVCDLIKEISVARRNNQSISKVIIDMGELTKIEDIRELGGIYELAYTGAGAMNMVMERCAHAMVSKLEAKNEMYLSINEKIFEMKVMSIMPFIIVLYISLTSRGYFDALYNNLTGLLIMSLCMGIYVAAYYWGSRLTNIEI